MIRYPLAQLTLQVLFRQGELPEEFGQKSREYAAKSFNAAKKLVQKAERSIPAKHWIDIPDDDKAAYDEMFRDVRVRLRDHEKVYNKTMLSLMRRIRCKTDATRAECADKRE